MAEVGEQETQLCDNCKREIPVPNFTIHEIHCRRNLGICHICKEPIPKSEMKNHMELEHTQVTCKCNMKLEKWQLKNHEDLECPLRLVVCQHCELELSFVKVKDHEDYCGARTELCRGCGRNVMVKDLKAHPEVCGKEEEEKREARSRPRPNYENEGADEAWFVSQTIKNLLGPEDPTRPLRRLPRPLENRFCSHLSVDEFFRSANRRNVSAVPVDQNLADEQGRLERNKTNLPSPIYGDENSHLDYMLALSLQNESSLHSSSLNPEIENFWTALYRKDSSPSRGFSRAQDKVYPFDSVLSVDSPNEMKDYKTMLPCEFCEELYPEEDLILHQTGCNPASVLASFRKRSSSPSPQRDHAGHFRSFLELPATRAPGSRYRSLLELPAGPSAEGSIIIPCEFCGVQLEEEILFHHQDQCDLRPATGTPAERRPPADPWLPKQDNLQKDMSPELTRRRLRHQGDLPACYLDDIKPEVANRSLYPLPPSRPVSNLAVTRNYLPKPPATGASGPSTPPQTLKPNNLEAQDLRGRSRSALSPGLGLNSGVRTPRGFYPENLTSGFPRPPPVRHGPRHLEFSPVSGHGSVKNDGGRTPRLTPATASFRSRTTKAKPQKPGTRDSEREEE
ncbi:TRAF-type zinc finger domain-containing protein 1 [Ornithorhynchus anatinus]|uniref:TRAF-type zinc finger domain-containing protein 1 n=1 Tax=Ornithorhynchus anatinus TaxID=9258 RepID=UPI0001554585|nr:TRAF-type zinc finger domain-containing protein 1 [Ornithorhynchus anatinus]